MKHCETFDHTADVGLDAWGDTLGELFQVLAEGLIDVICPRTQAVPTEHRTISVSAEDLEALAVDFLSEIAFILQTDRFAIASVSVGSIGENEVEAEIAGERYDPNRHEFNTEVKAVTYHQLTLKREGERWTGRVILDV